MIQLLSKLPFSVLYRISDFVYFMLYYVAGYRKKVVYNNLKNAFADKSEKEIKEIMRGFYKNLADIMVEIIKTFDLSKEELQQRVTIRNKHLLEDHIKEGKSVIALASHQCNWEWMFLGCCVHFTFPMDGIYKPISSPYFEKLILTMRTKFGGNQIPMEKTLFELKKRRNEPRAYGIMADQTPISFHQKYWTTFLNQETPFFMGAEKIVQLFQYPAVFVEMRKIKRGYYEITLKEIGQAPYTKGSHEFIERYTKEVEKLILESPPDWLWSHKRWKLKKTPEEDKSLS